MQQFQIGILDFSNITAMKGARTASKSTPREVRFLRDTIKKLGHIPKIYKVEKCQLYFSNRKPEILYNNKRIKGCDVLIPRVSVTGDIDLEISIVKQFQMMDIPVVNQYLPTARAKNKLRTLQILTYRGLPVPRTLVVRRLEFLDKGIKKVGGYPVIIKAPFGSYGVGVAIVESRRSLHSALDIIWRSGGSSILLIQEYVSEAENADYRAFVVGDKVIAAMKRTAPLGDFRSNLHLGGEAKKATLTNEEQRLAVRATQALGLNFSGVDILRSKSGPVIMEVNSNPGIEGIMKVTGVNVPKEIVRFAVNLAQKKNHKTR